MGDIAVLELPDGRALGYEAWGPADGTPLLFLHGSPGNRRAVPPNRADLDAHHVRLVSVDRPGYGLSTFKPHRRLRDWPDDVERLADHLGWARFFVIGHSGGGPHALATARYLPERIGAVATVGGYCPLDRRGPRSAPQRLGQLATKTPWLVRGVFATTFVAMRLAPELTLRTTGRAIADADRRLLAEPGGSVDYMRRSSPTAARAAAQDMAIMTGDWGFELEDITVPFVAWHGTTDKNVPFSHSEYAVAHVPDATLRPLEGEGHMLLRHHLDEIIASVLTAAPSSSTPDPVSPDHVSQTTSAQTTSAQITSAQTTSAQTTSAQTT